MYDGSLITIYIYIHSTTTTLHITNKTFAGMRFASTNNSSFSLSLSPKGIEKGRLTMTHKRYLETKDKP